MKKLILATALMFASISNAAEIQILEEIASPYRPFLKSEFQINKELGRAWVSVSAEGYDVDDSADTYRTLVQGLSFDKNTNTVVLNLEGQTVVCAKLVKKGLFKNERLEKTGACEIKTQLTKKQVDSGFEVQDVTVLEAFLVTK